MLFDNSSMEPVPNTKYLKNPTSTNMLSGDDSGKLRFDKPNPATFKHLSGRPLIYKKLDTIS